MLGNLVGKLGDECGISAHGFLLSVRDWTSASSASR
jgi:hypothetical protein